MLDQGELFSAAPVPVAFVDQEPALVSYLSETGQSGRSGTGYRSADKARRLPKSSTFRPLCFHFYTQILCLSGHSLFGVYKLKVWACCLQSASR